MYRLTDRCLSVHVLSGGPNAPVSSIVSLYMSWEERLMLTLINAAR
jgi:hypothetical protein